MNLASLNEYMYVENYETSKIPVILIQNKYVHKLSQLGKNIRLEKDFKYKGSDQLHLMKRIFCHDTGILGVLFHYYNIQYRFLLPKRYPFEGPDDFDTNICDNVYSKIPKRLYKRYLKYYKIETNEDIPKINNWTEHTTLKQVVDQYLLLKSNIIKIEKIRLFKKFIERLTKYKSLELPEEIELLIYEYI